MPPWLALCPAVAAAVGAAAWLLWQQVQRPAKDQQDEKQPHASTRRSSSRKRSGASSLPTPTGIPQHEQQRLQAFLHKVYAWRGWQGAPYHIAEAWHAVEQAAATAAGGSWQQQFSGKQLSDANCDALLRVIDTHLCAGKLLRRLNKAAAAKPMAPTALSSSDSNSKGAKRAAVAGVGGQQGGVSAGAAANCTGSISKCSGSGGQHNSPTATTSAAPAINWQCHSSPVHVAAADSGSTKAHASASRQLRCRVVQSWDAAWLAYFDTQDNAIYINCWRWAKDVSAEAPLNCEGVVCVSRLQMLMHTLAHELVHAVVYHLFPDIDSSSPAYTVNNRHGPIFQLLNKQLFGHSSDALEDVHVVSARGP